MGQKGARARAYARVCARFDRGCVTFRGSPRVDKSECKRI